MDIASSTVHIITAIGCSLIFFTFLRKARTDSTQVAQDNETGASPIKQPPVPSGKKKVRFSEEVAEPSRNNVEYRKRRGAKRVGERRRSGEEDGAGLQANRSALYRGLYRYRSQMSTVMTYG
ncbi:hypothetical protein AAC387_Pa08g0582 [Persea americana]